MKTSKFKIQVACAAGWYDLKETFDGGPYTVELFETKAAARAEVRALDGFDGKLRVVSADEREDWSPYPSAAVTWYFPVTTPNTLRDSDGRVIADIVHGKDRSAAEREANSRLIAGGPELLAALEHIACLVDLSKPEMQRAFDKAKAAIAKATISAPARRVITAQDWEWDRFGVCSDRPSVTVCEWPDRTGYYEQNARGEYVATVGNASESFATADACEAWLFANLESKH